MSGVTPEVNPTVVVAAEAARFVSIVRSAGIRIEGLSPTMNIYIARCIRELAEAVDRMKQEEQA